MSDHAILMALLVAGIAIGTAGCINTDLTVPGRLHTVHSMTEMMTRFLGLGFTPPAGASMHGYC